MNEEIKLESPIIFKNYLIGKESIYFDVPGEPFAKQRPRARQFGGFVTIYTPKETKKYEEKVRKEYKKIYKDQLLEGDITVEVEGFFSIPKSVTKTQKKLMLNGEVPHTKKPDCDNMAKVCLDALNGVAYHDDASITNLIISKQYSENAKVRITLIKN